MKRIGIGKKHLSWTSAQIIPLGFLLLIAVGTVLLLLPAATAAGERTSLLTALFTSTTSVCVTGLVVVDTYAHWSLFGQIVILLLIQLGGIGVIAVSSSVLLMLRRRLSIRDRVLLRDAFNLDSVTGMISFLRSVLIGVFSVEGVGAFLYAFAFVPRFGWAKGIWYSVFHSISAFCNAGIDILGPDSLAAYASDPLVLLVTAALIVIGGLGFIVWFDLAALEKRALTKKHASVRLSGHTVLVLLLTGGLILLGGFLVFLSEFRNPKTIGNMPLWQQILNSLFQSVTLRTAGFSAIPQGDLNGASVLVGCLLMFIGGSPMGTAGGVKTVTVFLLIVNAGSFIRNRRETLVFHRHVSAALIRKATAVILISGSLCLVMSTALLLIEPLPFADILYEVFSATGTVGLSRGVTTALSPLGRLLIIICMYLGRIGPVSLALFFGADDSAKNEIHHANGRFFVG